MHVEVIPESESRLNLLVALPYLNTTVLRVIRESPVPIRMLVDSGAFTAWRSGKPIQLDDYCRFLESGVIRPWRYFVLDVIGDPEATFKNYETMRARGFEPVPIFTRGTPVDELDRYYKTSDVVGIGGLVGTKGNKGFVNGIMEHVGKRRAHWLGFTAIDYLKHYKPFMADTSSWESGARFGLVKMYFGFGSRTVQKRQFVKEPAADIIQRVNEYGFNPRDLAIEKNWHGGYGLGRSLSAANGVALTIDVHKHLGTHLFMAATTDHAINLMTRHFGRQSTTRSTT